MASIKFYLDHPWEKVPGRKKRLKQTPVTVWICITFSRSDRLWKKTDFKVLPAQWDFKDGKAKGGSTIGVDINLKLAEIALQVQHDIINLDKKNSHNNSEAYRAQFIQDSLSNKTVHEAMDDFLRYHKQNSHRLTHEKFKTEIKRLKEFEEKKNIRLTFNSFTMSFMDEFRSYLANHKLRKRGTDKMLDSTIQKYIADLKSFLNWCVDREYTTTMTFRRWKLPQGKKSNSPVLSYEELIKFMEHKFENDELAMVRDIFCFGAFTGQRVGDILRFNKNDLKGDIWCLTQGKNDIKNPISVKIPLKGYSLPAMSILKRYKYKFPRIGEKEFNALLRTAGKKAGIKEIIRKERISVNEKIIQEGPKWEFMSSHMMRRTFITILLERGVPPTTIMKMTGHTKLETLMKYENTSDDAVIRELERVGKLPSLRVAK